MDSFDFMASSMQSIAFGMKYAGDWDAETVNGVGFLLFLFLVGYLGYIELLMLHQLIYRVIRFPVKYSWSLPPEAMTDKLWLLKKCPYGLADTGRQTWCVIGSIEAWQTP